VLAKPIDVDWAWVRNEITKRERLGSGNDSERNAAITKSLDESLLKSKELSKPNYIHTVKKISAIGKDFIELEQGVRFTSGKVTKYVKDATHIGIFLVTIGEGIEKAAGEFTKGKEPLEGYLLDRIGSFAVESLADTVEKRIRADYLTAGKSVSQRYSPGYCDWPIEEQRVLAKVMDFSKIGITLNESCMMSPKKSISAMLAIADNGIFNESGSTCGFCDKKDCYYRRNIVADV
jgi:hypothetical protein